MVKISPDIRKNLRTNIKAYIDRDNNSQQTLNNIFAKMDNEGIGNNDGKISKEEILDFFSREKVTEGFNEKQMEEFSLAFDEFQNEVNTKLDVKQKYKDIDTNPKTRAAYLDDMNTITMDEMTAYMDKLIEENFILQIASKLLNIKPTATLGSLKKLVNFI